VSLAVKTNRRDARRAARRNPKAQLKLPFDVYYCGWYEGKGRGVEPNRRTALLLASKFQDDISAREKVIAELVDEVRNEIKTRFDFITYALAKTSKLQHARILATALGEHLNVPIIGQSRFREGDLRDARILIVDDVMKSGHTLEAIYNRMLPSLPGHVEGLVYLMAHSSPGMSVV
jgi:hypothetical protein